MYRAHELKDIEHKESGGGQSASAKPQTAAARGAQSTQKTQPKPETDEFKDPDKNIDVCCLARNCLCNSCVDNFPFKKA
jgi:hypothetical protein